MTKENLLQHLQECCDRMFGCSLEMATEKQVYRAVCVAVRELLEDERRAFVEQTRAQENKQVYYMSMEFLVGTSLRNNLYNLGILDEVKTLLEKQGFSLDRLCGMEPDAGLGNGGLGRLASCYMDAATGLGYPVTGFSIRYEFGIFRQKIVDGWQMEFPDNWLEMGDVWLQAREDDAVEVKFGGEVREWMDNDRFKVAQVGYSSVMAVPYDMYISGYDSDAANRLVLWSAKLPQSFDMAAFSRGDYVLALERNAMAETISKVLYPADDHIQGKRLRLKQQYLLVSASLQSILKKHYKKYRTYTNLPEKVAIHINDTHPALCVPELMRLLIDEHDFGWDEAWDITCRTLSYTNHTVMSEALERWNVDLFREQLPRVYSICQEINRRLIEHLCARWCVNTRAVVHPLVSRDRSVKVATGYKLFFAVQARFPAFFGKITGPTVVATLTDVIELHIIAPEPERLEKLKIAADCIDNNMRVRPVVSVPALEDVDVLEIRQTSRFAVGPHLREHFAEVLACHVGALR